LRSPRDSRDTSRDTWPRRGEQDERNNAELWVGINDPESGALIFPLRFPSRADTLAGMRGGAPRRDAISRCAPVQASRDRAKRARQLQLAASRGRVVVRVIVPSFARIAGIPRRGATVGARLIRHARD
jgi:hypothetical protein